MAHKLHPDIPMIFLKPGEAHCGQGPARVVTILGSCVAIVLYHPVRRFGAICHAVMPGAPEHDSPGASARHDLTYVDASMAWMLSEFTRRGLSLGQVQAKVFGGASLLGNTGRRSAALAVGRQNAEAAFDVIRLQGITLMAWDVGGSRGRKIVFDPGTGEVWSKFVPKTRLKVTGQLV